MANERLMMLLEQKLTNGEYEDAARLASALADLEKAALLKAIREGCVKMTRSGETTKITISHANA